MVASKLITTPTIKVCGVTRREDVRLLADEGVTMVGLNFVPTSPRCLPLEVGQELAESVRRLGMSVVAVVRNAPVHEVVQLLKTTPIDYLQFHGEELPDIVASIAGELNHPTPPLIRALSWSGREEEVRLATAWQQFAEQQPGQLAAWLVDAYAPVAGGGTGRLADWRLLTPRPRQLAGHPLILAGGLGPHNVAEAIDTVRPAGVDAASGVEDSPGIKDAARVADFARRAREAFGA